MAVNPEDLLPVPSNYASPAQIAQARADAERLTKQSQDPAPIHSPYQGVAKIVQALMGGIEADPAGSAGPGAGAAARADPSVTVR